jgi:multimeric flavodoxin WrbA
MRALVLNATLKPAPESSNTEALARVVADALAAEQVEVSFVRLVDHRIDAGVKPSATGTNGRRSTRRSSPRTS